MFAAFEMAAIFGRLGDLRQEEVAELGTAIRRLIVRTLERSIRLRVAGSAEAPRIVSPECYDGFAELVSDMAARPIAVITFNYDLALDHGLYSVRRAIDYALTDEPELDKVAVLKLHGSINWGRCTKCQSIIPWALPGYFVKYGWRFPEPGQRLTFDLASRLHELSHCGNPVSTEP